MVAPGRRGRGVGAFILERLEDEAAARGLNYIYNVVPATHPHGAWIRNWLATHGFPPELGHDLALRWTTDV